MNGKIYNRKTGQWIYMPHKLIDFYAELKELCEKYNYSISHEDYHRCFIINEYDEDNMNLLMNADMYVAGESNDLKVKYDWL